MSPLSQVVVVYLVTLLIFPILAVVFLLGLVSSLTSNLSIYGSLVEFLLLGFVPLVFAVASHDKPERYGLTIRGLPRSVSLGFTLLGLRAGFNYVIGRAPFALNLLAFNQALAQPFPYSIGLALFTGFTYGPLEVFYIIFLVVKLDEAFPPRKHAIMSKGSFVGVALWALIHLNNALFFGLLGAAGQVVSNLVVGLILVAIFKYSGNSLGPMLYFTVANLAQ